MKTEGAIALIDLKKEDEIIDAANAVLNNGRIVELRPEKTGIAVVEIGRTLKTKKAYRETRSEKKEER